jgi:hypothetical protein
MNKHIHLFFAAVILTLLMTQNIYANVYASQLRISNPDGSPFDGSFTDGTGIQLSFILNDNASSVIIRIKDASDGSTITEIDAGALERGTHAIMWDGSGTTPGKVYIYEVTASQPNYSSTEWTMFFDSGGVDIYSRGLDVITDMSSPLFGLMYAPNNGGPLGKGITIHNPDGSPYDPFLVAKDVSSGGTIEWGNSADAMVSGVFDDLGRFYVSCVQLGEIRRLNLDYSVTTIIGGLNNPLGLFIDGTGDERTIYYCTDNKVLRAKIGDDDTFAGFPEEVGVFEGLIPRCIALDDEGNLYVSFRTEAANLNADGAGLFKFPLSGTLPVHQNNGLWGIDASASHKISDLQFDYGQDRNSNGDDILYYATRADAGNNDDGIWRVDDINSFFAVPVKIITEIELYGGDDNINARSGLALDAAGNLILFENANEHIFFISPPGEGSKNSFTTICYDSIKTTGATDANEKISGLPFEFKLNQNYPNPFNPSTTISFQLAEPTTVSLRVYNLLGEEVSVLLNNEFKSSGYHSIVFNAEHLSPKGSVLTSGVYIYTLHAGSKIFKNKMTLMK